LSAEEHIREFENLLTNCDIEINEDQTSVKYLGGLDLSYANVIEL